MKNVKVGEPGAGIALIEPPQANSRGTASLSYPIETPPGRNGVGPNLGLTYDSDRVNSNGWLGVGWDLRMSSIEIDTRFGVPKYDVNDVYLLDGAMLKSTTGGKYVKRIEGSFDLIQRSGTGPTAYSWTVTDKRGTVYTYGTVANSRLANPRSGAENGRIFRWYLEKVQDTFGNVMTVTYTHDTYSTGTSPNVETFDEVYPSAIDYTSSGTLAANYHVTFLLDAVGTRPDMMIAARSGFLVSTRRRLKDIKIKSGTTLVRQYRFEYLSNLTDTMQKSVLAAVALWGVEDTTSSELYRHTFEYNKAPAATAAFSDEKTWGQAWQAAPPPQTGYVPRYSDGLSHSVDGLVGGSITLGVGFPYIAVTGNFGMDYGWVAPDLAFLGITGQGLPDLIDANGTLSQNDPLLFPPATNHFAANAVTNPPSLGGTDRSGWTAGGDISAMQGLFGGGASYARHVQDDHTILTDMNGDGFPDAAHLSGSAFFAYINDGNRNFTEKQWTGYSLADSPFSTAARLADVNVANTIFGASPLIRWVAPFTGQVTINSQANVGNPLDDVVVEFYVANDAAKSTTMLAGQAGTAFFATNYVRNVSAGDKIYLRAKGVGDHAGSSSISWPTSIVYTPPSGMSAGDLGSHRVANLQFRQRKRRFSRRRRAPRPVAPDVRWQHRRCRRRALFLEGPDRGQHQCLLRPARQDRRGRQPFRFAGLSCGRNDVFPHHDAPPGAERLEHGDDQQRPAGLQPRPGVHVRYPGGLLVPPVRCHQPDQACQWTHDEVHVVLPQLGLRRSPDGWLRLHDPRRSVRDQLSGAAG